MRNFLEALDRAESLVDSSLLDLDSQVQELAHRLQANLEKLHNHIPESYQRKTSDIMLDLRDLLALSAVLRARCELETSTANVLPADVRCQIKERAFDLRTRIKESSSPQGQQAEIERELELAPRSYGQFLQSLLLWKEEASGEADPKNSIRD